MKLYSYAVAVFFSSTTTYGFAPNSLSRSHDPINQQVRQTNFLSSSTTMLHMASKIIVVSPPGGVGEVAAVKAACLGSSVRWLH
jgi:hypothetical protein